MRRLKAAWRAFRHPELLEASQPIQTPGGLIPPSQGVGQYRVVRLHNGYTVGTPYQTANGSAARRFYDAQTPNAGEEVLFFDHDHCRGAKRA